MTEPLAPGTTMREWEKRQRSHEDLSAGAPDPNEPAPEIHGTLTFACECPDRPELAVPISSRLLPWECGRCGRVWAVAVGGSSTWWEETRGPSGVGR